MARSILTAPAALLLMLTVGLSHAGLSNSDQFDQNGLLLEPHIQPAQLMVEELEPSANQESSAEKIEHLEEMHLTETEETPLEVIYNLPQWVDEVTSVCPWRSASDEQQQGYIRLIRTKENGANLLYVQWMQKLPPNKDVALATRVIDEIAQGPRLKIELPQQELHSRFCKLTAYARSLDSSNDYRIKLKLDEPGKYQFELVQVLGRSSR